MHPTGRHEMDEHRQHRPLRAPLQAEDIKRQKHQPPCTSPEAQGSRASCASAATRSTVSHKAGQHQQHHEHPPRSRYGREAYKEPQGSVITSITDISRHAFYQKWHQHSTKFSSIMRIRRLTVHQKRKGGQASRASAPRRSGRSQQVDEHQESALARSAQEVPLPYIQSTRSASILSHKCFHGSQDFRAARAARSKSKWLRISNSGEATSQVICRIREFISDLL